MTQSLDEIMDDNGASAEVAQQQESSEQQSQPRDQSGRFASNQAAQPQEQNAADQQQAQTQAPPEGFVPIQAMDERVGKWRKRHDDVLTQNQTLQRQVAELMSRLPQPHQAQPAQAPDIWENPNAAIDHRFQENIRGVIDPLHNQLMFNARLVAEGMHGKEQFDAAVQAFDQAVASGQADPRDVQRVRNSPNPFHEAVLWHQRNTVLNEIGDPVSYRERVRKELLAEMQSQQSPQAQQQSAQRQVMPSSFAGARNSGQRSVPEFAGPLPLSEIMGGR